MEVMVVVVGNMEVVVGNEWWSRGGHGNKDAHAKSKKWLQKGKAPTLEASWWKVNSRHSATVKSMALLAASLFTDKPSGCAQKNGVFVFQFVYFSLL